jgi:hypothetical protein
MSIHADRKTFEKEFAAWNDQNIENYKFTYEYWNGIGKLGPVSITIAKQNEPVIENFGFTSLDNYPAVLIQDMSGVFNFIRGTFDHIDEIKNGYYNNKKGYTVDEVWLTIEYNAQYHYPEKVSYGVSFVQKGIVGQPGFDFKIIEFSSGHLTLIE